MDTTARDLFEKLKGQFKNLTLGKEDGTRTLIPGETSFFEFDYHSDESKLGSVVVSLVDEGSLKVYFATNIMDDANSESKDNWYGFLRGLRKFATQNMLNYEAKNISKQRLDKGDFEYLSKQNKTEEELTMESKLYGSRQKSYQDLNGAKLIVQHTKTVDEDKMGSRSRNIRAVYIENSDGERFKFENNYLPGARAMARHVSNGGYPRDEFGTHISEIMSEMSELRTFVRGVKGKDDYINEDAKDIIEKATGRYYGLKSTLESVSKQRGYTDYFENYEPTTFEVSEDDINDLKQKLTREVFDSKLENSLGAVGKAMKYNDQLQEKKSDGEYNDYPQWEKAAKREKADIIDGNIEDLDNKQEVTMYKIAMSGDEELGAWIQYQKDLDDPKVGQSVTIPGYGEFAAQAGVGDRGETDEREFIVPDSLELSPGGTPLSSMQYASKEDLLNLLMVDIASRAMDDEVANFAGKMADKVGSVGGTFGQDPKDPAYKADKKKAVALANMYIKQINKKDESVEEDEVPFEETTKTDPFDAYAESMDRIVEYDVALDEEPNEGNEFSGALAKAKMDGKEEFEVDGKTYKVKEEVDEAAKPDFLDLDGDGDKKEPMKKAAKDKKKVKEENISERVILDPEGNVTYHPSNDPRFGGKPGTVPTVKPKPKPKPKPNSGYKNIGDVKDTSGYTNIGGAKADPTPNDGVNPGLYPDAPNPMDPDFYSKNPDPLNIRGGLGIREYMKKHGIEDTSTPLPRNPARKDGKYSGPPDVEEYMQDPDPGALIGDSTFGNVDQDGVTDPDRRFKKMKIQKEDDMAWLRKAAGIGSGAKSNHGIHEGEEGYQITPRSLVAREMRKLQDIAKD
jgi:Rod binding domain-containing protein